MGLLAAYSALLRGASRVYVVDAIPERLEKARELGAVEKPVGGVDCAIDCIGFQARSQRDYTREDPVWVTGAIAELMNPVGRVGPHEGRSRAGVMNGRAGLLA